MQSIADAGRIWTFSLLGQVFRDDFNRLRRHRVARTKTERGILTSRVARPAALFRLMLSKETRRPVACVDAGSS
jgi:hypothetical protein